MASIKKILPPQPQYLTGYTGFVPGLKFHCGESYGKLTNTLFLDKRINRSDKPVLSELGKAYTGLLSKEDKEAMRKRCHENLQCIYTEDMKVGYSGFVPQYKNFNGHRFSEIAAIGICKFTGKKNACLCPQCKPLKVEENKIDLNKKNEDGTYTRTRPSKELPGGSQKINELYAYKKPMHPISPYFMEMENPKKYFIQGYAGHVPSLQFHDGNSNYRATNEVLKEFTSCYEERKAKAKLPAVVGFTTPRPKMVSRTIPYEVGIMKNYAGHIPGSVFNVGQTFSEGSKSTRIILGMDK